MRVACDQNASGTEAANWEYYRYDVPGVALHLCEHHAREIMHVSGGVLIALTVDDDEFFTGWMRAAWGRGRIPDPW